MFEYGTAYSFVNDADDATPVIRWADRNTLTISIKKISYLKYRAENVDGVRIEANIEEVEFK